MGMILVIKCFKNWSFQKMSINVRWSTNVLLLWKSAIYHSIKLPFDVEVAEKFLSGIYSLHTELRTDEGI